MHSDRLVLRLSVVVGMLAVLVVVPATSTLAGTDKATPSVVAQPGALTLNDDGVSPPAHFGVLKAALAAQNTATHVVLNVSITTTTTANSITFVKESLPPGSSGCTVSGAFSLTCNLANVASSSTQVTFIEYQAPFASTCATTPCSLSATATFTYAEGSNDNSGGPNGTVNDTVTATTASPQLLYQASDKVTADGNCITFMPSLSSATLGTQASTTANQGTQAVFGPASGTAPCTAGAVGVDARIPPGLHTGISFVALPTLDPNNPVARVNVTLFTLPSGVTKSNFQLNELVGYVFGAPLSSITNTVPVQPCQYGAIPANADSCVLTQGSYGHGGVIVTMLVRTSGDPGYSG